MMELNDVILKVNVEVHAYRYHEAMALVPELIEAIMTWQEGLGERGLAAQGDINEILEFVNQAIMDRDYLRMADILEHELLNAVKILETPKEDLQ